MSDITGLQSLDPSIALKAKQIQNMPPEKAISFLLSNGVSSQVAAMVMKNMALKKAAAQQGQAQPPQKTVSQDLDDKVNSIAATHPRASGIASLPVPDQMFDAGDHPQSMAAGGIVAFDDGGYINGPPMGAPGNVSPTDAMSMQQYAISSAMLQQQQQNQAQQQQQAAQQQAQAMAQQAQQQGMKRGGIVGFADGGNTLLDDPDNPAYNPANSPPHISNAQRLFSGIKGAFGGFNNALDRAGGISNVGVAPIDRQVAGPNAPAAPTGAAAASPLLGNAGLPPQGQIPGPQGQMQFGPGQNTQPMGGAPQPPRPPMPQGPAAQGAMQARMSQSQMPVDVSGERQQMQAALAQSNPNAPGNTSEDLLTKNMQLADKLGIGKASESYLQDLADRKQQLGVYAQQGKYLALAQAGFAMATAATQNPRGGFLGALAVGGQKGAEEYGQTMAAYHSNLAKTQDLAYQVEQSQENLKYDMSKNAQKMHQDIVDRYDRMYAQMMDTQFKSDQLVNSRAVAKMYANAMGAKEANDPFARELNEWSRNQFLINKRQPTLEEFSQAASQVYQNSPGMMQANVRAQASEANNAANVQVKQEAIMNSVTRDPGYADAEMMARSKDPARAAQGNAEIQRIIERHKAFFNGGAQGPAQGAGGPNPSNLVNWNSLK